MRISIVASRTPVIVSLLLLGLVGSPPAAAQDRPGGSDAAWWLAAGGIMGGAILLDGEIRSRIPEGGGTRWEPLTDRLNYLGHPGYVVPALVAGYASGRVARRPGLSRSSIHALGALFVAGVANGTLKTVVGRERPAGGDRFTFSPFNLENRWQSFPSGHSTVAFSVATALSEEADRGWVTGLTYSAASLVAWSRVYEDKHWSSDVVGGAVLGVAATRAGLSLMHRLAPHTDATAAPTLVIAPTGFTVTLPLP